MASCLRQKILRDYLPLEVAEDQFLRAKTDLRLACDGKPDYDYYLLKTPEGYWVHTVWDQCYFLERRLRLDWGPCSSTEIPRPVSLFREHDELFIWGTYDSMGGYLPISSSSLVNLYYLSTR